MNLENRKELRDTAKQRLEQAHIAAKIALIYASVIVGSSLLVNGLQLILDNQISQSGGLQNMGLRSVLSTIQTMLPIVLNFLLMCLGLGFTGAMLRISRGQYTSLNSLRIGFERFWVLLRATLLQGGLYLLAIMAANMISMQIFFLTPMSNNLMAAASSVLDGSTQDVMVLLENPAVMEQMVGGIFKRLQEKGITILMVSHDVEFCASYGDTCSLFFDGGAVTTCEAREFFTGNSFYTTAANRMARALYPDAVTVKDVIEKCRKNQRQE